MDGTPREELSMTTALSRPDLHPAMQELLNRTDVTVAELAHLPEDLRYELINGRLVLSPTATPLHGFLSSAICHAIDIGCPPEYIVTVEQSIHLNGLSERRPDVAVVEASEFRRSPVLHTDVLLAVEVISPSHGSDERDRKEKLKEYAYSGIPSYWLVDPDAERITFRQYLLGDGGVYHQHVETDELITVDLPWEITLDLPAWTRRRDGYQQFLDARRDS
jgi:Uma2 family endonuclease